jgi:hypothetical protein
LHSTKAVIKGDEVTYQGLLMHVEIPAEESSLLLFLEILRKNVPK